MPRCSQACKHAREPTPIKCYLCQADIHRECTYTRVIYLEELEFERDICQKCSTKPGNCRDYKQLEAALDSLHGGLRERELEGLSPDSKGVVIAFAGAATGASSPTTRRESPRLKAQAKRKGSSTTTTARKKKLPFSDAKVPAKATGTAKKPPPAPAQLKAAHVQKGSYPGCCIEINGVLTDFSVPHANCGIDKDGENLGLRPSTQKKTSAFWKAYHVDPQNKKKAICNRCGASLGTDGTNGLIKHLKRYHKEVHRFIQYPQKPPLKKPTVEGEEDKKPAVNQSDLRKHGVRKATKEEVEQAEQKALQQQALYFVGNSRPFSDADSDNFRIMLKAVAEAAKIGAKYTFGQDTVKDQATYMADITRDQLTQKVKGKTLTATIDHWTSRAKQTYASLTVHWIEDFTLHSAVLAVYLYKEKGSSDKIMEDFVNKLEQFEIEKEVRWVVTDTAATMNLFGKKLAKKGKEHLYCLDHCLQLIANIAYGCDIFVETAESDEEKKKRQDDEDIDEKELKAKGLLGKVRKIVNFFNSSTTALAEIREDYANHPPRGVTHLKTKDFTLTNDVVTRWWSTYNMLDRFLHLKEQIEQYELNHEGAFKPLVEEEWDILDELHTLLEPFKIVQEQLEGAKYVTASLVLILVNIVYDALVAAAKDISYNEAVRECASDMLADFQNRFGDFNPIKFNPNVKRGERDRQVGISPVYIMAHALDPRLKGLDVIQSSSEQEKVWGAILDEMVDEEMNRQQEEKDKHEETLEKEAEVARQQEEAKQNDEGEGGQVSLVASFLQRRKRSGSARKKTALPAFVMDKKATITTKMRNELSLYRGAAEMEYDEDRLKDSNPLEWWSRNAENYPNVWNLAEQYLAVPATSAPSERAFSTAGNLVTMRRCRLKPDLVEDCVVVNENIELTRELMKEGKL